MSALSKLKISAKSSLLGIKDLTKSMFVKVKDFNKLIDLLDTGNANYSGDPVFSGNPDFSGTPTFSTIDVSGVATLDGGIKITDNITQYTVLTTLSATQIVGTAAGDIGHADGAILVAAPSSDYALQFVQAVLVYDYSTDAYTGGNDDAVIRIGTVAHTAALTDANYIKAAGDKVYVVRPLNAAELSLPVGSTINLAGTAFTNPGTAAGVLRVYTTYNVVTTGL